uniref:Uncharacterized protein n=1 Tax=Oryza nivara TaxID=4536 RepID=A0A0E0IR97_ORYNI
MKKKNGDSNLSKQREIGVVIVGVERDELQLVFALKSCINIMVLTRGTPWMEKKLTKWRKNRVVLLLQPAASSTYFLPDLPHEPMHVQDIWMDGRLGYLRWDGSQVFGGDLMGRSELGAQLARKKRTDKGERKEEEDKRVSCLSYGPEVGARLGGGMGIGGEPKSVAGGTKSSWAHGTDKGRLET